MKSPNGRIFTADFWIGFWRHAMEYSLHTAMQIVIILAAYFLLSAILTRLIDTVLSRVISHRRDSGDAAARTGRLHTLKSLCKSTLAYVLAFVFGVTLLKAIGFDIMPFITTAGVIGLAVGFGSQKLVKDVISGFFIIVDDLFDVGETVTIGTVTGRVQDLGMRVTRLVDTSGKVIFLANGDIGTISNLSRNPVEEFVEVALAASADLSRALTVIDAAGDALFAQDGHHLKAPPHCLGMTAISAASVTVRISVVTDPGSLTIEQMRVRSAVRDALAGAELPLA